MTFHVRLSSLLVFVLFVACASLGRAHEFTMDAVMNAFVRVDANEAHLVIRAPLFLFKQVRFPVKGAEIDVANAAPAMERALTALQENVTIFADGKRLVATSASGRLSLPSDRSFQVYEKALAHVAAPVERDTAIYIDQGYVDARFSYPLSSPHARLSVLTTVAPDVRDYLKLVVRYVPSSGEAQTIVITSRSGEVPLDPTWSTAAWSFIGFGIAHIVTGFDHLLFLLCLLIPLRGLQQVLVVVTGFTLAHSVTLIGSAFNLAPVGAWFPPFVEVVVALSIVYMALENIIGVDLRRRLLLTMLFGLVHGFGFSYGLREDLQFAGSHLITSLLAFNVGVEIGQVLMLALMLPALAVVARYVLPGRIGTIILCAILANIGWDWMTERWEALTSINGPTLDLASVTVLLFWLAGLALAAGVVVTVTSRLGLEAFSGGSAGRRISEIRAGD